MHKFSLLLVFAVTLGLVSAFGCSSDDEPEACKTYVETGDEKSCNECLKLMPNLREKLCSLADDNDSEFCNVEKCKFDRCCTPSDIPHTLPNGCPICFKTSIKA